MSDNFDERIEQKIFHAEIVVDTEKVKAETAKYKKLPQIVNFLNSQGVDTMTEQIRLNYERIKQDVLETVSHEIERIKSDPKLKHLIKEE